MISMAKFIKALFIIVIIAVLFLGMVLLIRFVFGGNEDTWICKNGAWVKHGNPSQPMPVIPCEKETEGKAIDNLSPTGSAKAVSFEDSQKVAENYALTAPTYKFDGSALKFESSESLPCVSCWKYNYSFTSSHAGLGDRKGLMLAQVITSHTLSITVKEGKVEAAVTDLTYDELNSKYIK